MRTKRKLSITLDEELYEWLEEEGGHYGRSRIINEALRAYQERQEAAKAALRKRQKKGA